MTLSCEGKPEKDKLPATIRSEVAEHASLVKKMDLSDIKRVEMVFSFVKGMGAMNHLVFDHDDPFVHTSKVGTYELWVIRSESAMDHPFHQHVNPGVILDITGGDPDYAKLYRNIPAFKDTVNVPPFGTVTMLVPIEHFTGDTVFHCHILEHEDIGMLGLWKIE
jgi:FtsP/CotA-like multicopper oxidase with cupredoxin domain